MIGGERLRQHWEQTGQTPFGRLVQLSLNRMLHGAQEDSDEIDADVGRLLVLLTIPGAIVSFILFDKYGTLLQFIRGQMRFDPYRASVSDEYFFIALSMAVCGCVAVWKAESIFPDRRDYLNLVPLPVRPRSILLANLCGLALFSLLFAADVNAVSGWMFPVVVAASNGSMHDFGVFLLSHLVAVGAASLFSFAAVFALLGTAMTVLPNALYRRVSLHINSAVIIAMLALLSTTNTLAAILSRGDSALAMWTRFLPSVWFVGFCEAMRGVAYGGSTLWPRALMGLAGASALALLTYMLQYRRHFLRIGEALEGPAWTGNARWLRPFSLLLDAVLLRTPFERAGYRYIFRTLGRSARHRVVFAGFIGLGAVIAVKAVGPRAHSATPSVAWLSIGFILNFWIIAGLRYGFDLPAEMKANWTFRLWVSPDEPRCLALARKAVLSVALACTWTIELALYASRWGWRTALVNAAVVSLASILLTEVMIGNFRKIPFAYAYPAFKQGTIVNFIIIAVGFIAFSFGTPTLEAWAMPEPWRFTVIVPIAAAAGYGIARYRSELIEVDRRLTFEERSAGAVELLNLNSQ